MGRLLGIADKYIQQSDWKVLALIKFCLFSVGMLFGMLIPEKARKVFTVFLSIVFVATYIPLMMKFIALFCDDN